MNIHLWRQPNIYFNNNFRTERKIILTDWVDKYLIPHQTNVETLSSIRKLAQNYVSFYVDCTELKAIMIALGFKKYKNLDVGDSTRFYCKTNIDYRKIRKAKYWT